MTCFLALSVTACGESEPVYSGISIMGQNYLPFNLSSFTITDAYGNKAGGGADSPPGGGGGRLSCCYKLKGTEFTVKWSYYDADQWTMEDSHMQHAEANVVMPPSPIPQTVGSRIFEVHFFPDHHVELQFPGELLDESRIPVVDVSRWMWTRYQPQLDRKFDDTDGQSHRRISRVIAAAWLRYRLTDQSDLEQFVYFNLLVNDQFDAHPEIQRILNASGSKAGAFAKAIQTLPKNVMSELRSNHFKPVAVPAVRDELLPPLRVKEIKHG
jgi:hypothetical protein